MKILLTSTFLVALGFVYSQSDSTSENRTWSARSPDDSDNDPISKEELKKLCGFEKSQTFSGSSRSATMLQLPESTAKSCNSAACLPKSFSWVDQKNRCPSLGHIGHQKVCGSCWAVSAAAVISDRHCLRIGENRIFSGAETTACAMKNHNGCQGGDPIFAMDYYVRHGICTGGDPTIRDQPAGCQPYPNLREGDDIRCKSTCQRNYNIPYSRDIRKGISIYSIRSGDVTDIKLDLLNYGPLVATMKIYDDFIDYKSGIYRHYSRNQVGAHAVRLLGWGEERGVPYWLCANSWSTRWGSRGFFRILLGRNECDIESYLIGVETENDDGPDKPEPTDVPNPRPRPPHPRPGPNPNSEEDPDSTPAPRTRRPHPQPKPDSEEDIDPTSAPRPPHPRPPHPRPKPPSDSIEDPDDLDLETNHDQLNRPAPHPGSRPVPLPGTSGFGSEG